LRIASKTANIHSTIHKISIRASPLVGYILVKHHNLSELILFLLPTFNDLATKIGLDEINSKKWLVLVTNPKRLWCYIGICPTGGDALSIAKKGLKY
jgi:hypothetical protein